MSVALLFGVDPALRSAEPAEQELAGRVRRAHGELEEGVSRHAASLDRHQGRSNFHLQTLDFWQHLVHPPCMGRLLKRIRQRRRDRELSRQLEQRFRGQVDAAAEAAARLADDIRR